MDVETIKDAELLKQLIESGTLDRLILKVKGKIADSLFKTEEKEHKKREDFYCTYVAFDALKKELVSFTNDYKTHKNKVGA